MKKKTVYKGKPVSIDVYNLTVEGRKVRRELIQHPGAAAILAFVLTILFMPALLAILNPKIKVQKEEMRCWCLAELLVLSYQR